jgi:hypothetical protein
MTLMKKRQLVKNLEDWITYKNKALEANSKAEKDFTTVYRFCIVFHTLGIIDGGELDKINHHINQLIAQLQ